jgi:HSP20 family molecular chaperone IbpA
MPGVTLDSLEVQVQDNRLTIFGRVAPSVPAEAKLLHQEFEFGDFLRSFILSDEVDYDRIAAKLNNGVLEVVLPKAPKAEPRRIQVKQD